MSKEKDHPSEDRELRVVKLGGSLLDLPDLKRRFFKALPPKQNLKTFVVVGGGDLVNAVRELDAIHDLGSDFTHWMCIDLLSSTAAYLSKILAVKLLNSCEQLDHELEAQSHSVCVVDVKCFYHKDLAKPLDSSKPILNEIPTGWETTSDTLAALLTLQLNARELVLLKSVTLHDRDIEQWAVNGIVDPIFPKLASKIASVSIRNLREI